MQYFLVIPITRIRPPPSASAGIPQVVLHRHAESGRAKRDGRRAEPTQQFVSAGVLADGFDPLTAARLRSVEVREFSNGETYLVERERVDGNVFEDRHSGRMVGPFASPEVAERFIVATTWFCGREV
jgi:hypothetical protein